MLFAPARRRRQFNEAHTVGLALAPSRHGLRLLPDTKTVTPVGGLSVVRPLTAAAASAPRGSRAAGAAQRLLTPRLGAGPAGKFGTMTGFERVDAPQRPFKLGDLLLDTGAGGA